MNSTLSIRPMMQADCAAVAALEQSCGLSSWGESGYERELENPQAILLVAYAEQNFAGYFAGRVMSDEFELFSIAVQPELRQRGIGQALLDAGLEVVRRPGIATCFLEVRAANLAAQSLYVRNGFSVIGRRRNYYHNPVDDAVLMHWSATAPNDSSECASSD